jgi:hypothetical protein
MPTFTDFLNLTLPELGEFVDSWNEPNNQNFEAIDDWTDELHANLVGTGTGSTWAALRGTENNLADRLAVSINPDGTVNISGSQDILDMSTSAYKGTFSGPSERLDDADREIFEAGSPIPDARFTPIVPAGPSAGFPHAELDDGIAIRCADYGADAAEALSSPHVPWAPGLVTGGADPIITGSGTEGQVEINAATTPALFNIDGYIFRLRENILFDYALISPSNLDYVWIYVERKAVNYNDANFKYSDPGGTPAAKDLRKRKSGANGTTSGSTFSVGSGTFDTEPFKAKEGDILRITSGGAAGDYVINALDGSTPNTKLTIKGTFKADLGPAVPYEVFDPYMPNIGAVVSSGTPSDPTSPPDFEEGRVYIGRVRHQGSGSPDERVSFTRGGVHDSGWLSITDISTDFPLDVDHNLGAVPSSMDIWVRANSTTRAFRPMVRRQIVADFDEGDGTVDPGDAKKTTFLVPSLYAHSSEVQVTLAVLNVSPDVSGEDVAALFTDAGGTDQTTGQIRIVSRR